VWIVTLLASGAQQLLSVGFASSRRERKVNRREGKRLVGLYLWYSRVCALASTINTDAAGVYCNSENIGPTMGTLLRPTADFEGTLLGRCDLRCER
jgi:hypothetical protein